MAGANQSTAPANFNEVSKHIESLLDLNTSTIVIRDEKRINLLKKRNN